MGCTLNSPITACEQEEVAPQGPATPCRDSVATHKACPSFHRCYLLEEKIGEGFTARVYNCRRADGGPEGDFAVKIVDFGRLKADQHAASDCCSRARREASLLKAMGNRDHCCRFIDSMVDQRFHYLVMEKCSTTLSQVLKHMPVLTERNLATLVHQMFIAVSEVHALKVLHRDVKLDNFLVGPGATVKLCDFGFARRFPSGPACVRGTFGTAPFMSPEMILGLAYAAPTDVWSLGVSLYVLLCGDFPYKPETPCKQFMKAAIATGLPRPAFAPAVAGVWLSTGAVELLQALLNRDPEMRPSATDALAYHWFRAAAGEAPARELPSLKGNLLAAEQVGAFGPCNDAYGAGVQGARSMDRALQELQKKYRLQEARGPPSDLRDEGDVKRSLGHRKGRTPSCSPEYLDENLYSCVPQSQVCDSSRIGVMIST